MARANQPTRLRTALAVAPIAAICVALTCGAAFAVESRARDAGDEAFAQQSSVLADSIERQIERHVVAVDDTAAFAEATWPGDIHEWRAYVTQRINDWYLAFSSSAGLIERVPVEERAAVEARETASSGQPFEIIVGAAPERPTDHLVLTRTSIDMTSNGIPIRGLDTSQAVEEFGLDLPRTEDGLVIVSLADAPAVVGSVLGITASDVDDVPVVGTDVVFVQALGDEGAPPLGWVVAPAQLGHFLTSAVSDIPGAVNATIAVPQLGLGDELGTYEGAKGVAFDGARHAAERNVEIGGLTWEIKIWADREFGQETVTIEPSEVLVSGMLVALAFTALLYGRRRHQLRLGSTEVELSKQRTMTETDSLTGLLNRQGLEARLGTLSDEHATTVLFIDVDDFKLVNDRHGHTTGDRTLKALASAIQSAARDADLVARLGGDEFVVVCPKVGDEAVARHIADRFAEAVAATDEIEPLAVSIGIALRAPGDPRGLETMIEVADLSMYQAKRSGGARTVVADRPTPLPTQPTSVGAGGSPAEGTFRR